MTAPALTIGIEEEYQIVDPRTRALTSYVQELLEQGRIVLQDQIKPELMRSQIEVGSHICRSMAETRAELIRMRRTVHQVAQQNGLAVIAASTHPFSSWSAQELTAGERYTKLAADLGEVARRLLIFGMHIHVGIEDRELLIDVMNDAIYFLPHILALTTSSPFWHGRDTGLKSYRSVVFENLPRTGLPPYFDSWSDCQKLIETLVATGCVDEPTKIWWDVRPHPKFPTLEFRIPDICTRIEETLCVTGLVVALVTKLMRLRQENLSWRRYRRTLIKENKWRAVRFGLEGSLIDFGKQREVPMRDLAVELVRWLDDVLDEVGVRAEVEYIDRLLSEGNSADRQLRIYRQTRSFEAVIDHLAEETVAGCL
jgi:carboxylate-amine ligase